MQKNPADFFSKKKKLFEIKEIKKDQLSEQTKLEARAEAKAIKDQACQDFQKEVESAVRNFITNTLHRLAVDYAHKHHEHGVTATMLLKIGIDEIKKEVDSSK